MKKSAECQSAHCHDFCVSRLYVSHAFLRDREREKARESKRKREREIEHKRERERGEKEKDFFLSFKEQSVLLKKLIKQFKTGTMQKANSLFRSFTYHKNMQVYT